MIDFIDKKCSTQKLLLCTSYFLSYCPLLIFIFLSWPFLLNNIVYKATHPTCGFLVKYVSIQFVLFCFLFRKDIYLYFYYWYVSNIHI
jgi:hypothetical protein